MGRPYLRNTIATYAYLFQDPPLSGELAHPAEEGAADGDRDGDVKGASVSCMMFTVSPNRSMT